MKLFTSFLAMLIVTTFLFAEAPEKYSQVKIFVPDKATLDRIWSSGIDFEGSTGTIGGWMEFVTGPGERVQLQSLGIPYTVVQDDLSKKNIQGITPGPVNALGFGYGSMGGYYTYTEVKKQLDSMKISYPNLITAKDSISDTHEGRGIYLVKISDNPDEFEIDEPEVLYTSLHHAREPEGMMTVLYYMWWLLENYGTNPDATYLVNNRQMYFIPVLNPDGYVYNQTTNPGGGGMWRKNRRNNGSGSYGVDLNRNYGPQHMWDSPYGGSSTNIWSDTYRGPSPFSEPEVFAVAEFMYNHTIMACLNYHTYGNYLVNPWGYQPSETNDSITYREFSFDMVKENRYLNGTDQQTVNYGTRGGSDDFMYGGAYNRTFAMTPEVGTTGFWPSTPEILPLAQENLSSNIYLSYIGGQYSVLNHTEIIDADNDGTLEPGEPFTFAFKIKNKGLGDALDLNLVFSTSDSSITFTSNGTIINLIPARSESTLSFSGDVSPNDKSIRRIEVYLSLSDPNGYQHEDTISLIIGQPTLLFTDSAANGMNNWNGGWGTTTSAHTLPSAFADSPSGDYDPGTNNSLTLKNLVSLHGYQYCIMKFWTHWEIQPTFDFATIEVSTDGGTAWTSLRSKIARHGSARGIQGSGTWGYDGYTPGMGWVEDEVDLTDYINKQVTVRFRLRDDGSDQRDGWSIDDIRIIGYREGFPSLYITDHGSTSGVLKFGEHASATDALDNLLGEQELPAKPGPGTFDIRWTITGTNGTKLDLKSILDETHTSNIFVAEIQPGSGGYPVILRWNPADLSSGGWKLRDGTTHGGLVCLNMWTDTIFTISDPSIQSMEIHHTLQDTLTVPVNEGWHMLSAPIINQDRSKTYLFSGSTSDAFAYNGSYQTSSTIDYQRGYWIKYSQMDTIRMIGVPIVSDTIQIPTGWWIVSGLSCPIPRTYIRCNTPPCLPWIYVGYYRSDTTIAPGEGFWMKGPRTITLSCFTPLTSFHRNPNATDELNSLNRLTATDNIGRKMNLYFGVSKHEPFSLTAYDLPPSPPLGSFDIRFSSQRFVEFFTSQEDDSEESKLILHSTSYPITISWDVSSTGNHQFELSDDDHGNKIGIHTITAKGSLIIRDPDITSLILRKRSSTIAPLEYALNQNYPNPFNPLTTIKFDIPYSSLITLKVLDILGREVKILIDNSRFEAGVYRITFEGDDLPSGMYFYAMTANSTDGSAGKQIIKKMILLK